MLGSLLAQAGLPLLISILGEALNSIDTPVTKSAAKALSQVDAAIKAGQLTNEQIAEANRHTEKMA